MNTAKKEKPLIHPHIPYYFQLSNQIRSQIENGDLKDGEKLPKEVDLAKMYSISRVPVRQALGLLEKDGLIDIWNNYEDVFASIANYLTSIDKNPWNSNIRWGREVIPPKNINVIYNSLKQKNPKGCYAVKTMSVEKTLKEWSKLGFKKLDNSNISTNDIQAKLVAPDKLEGRMFLVYRNYKPILYYNCSHYYALTIGLLSDEIGN